MSLYRDQFGYVDLPDPISSAETPPTVGKVPARLTLELSRSLRSQMDEAAAREGLSLDSWLETAIATRLSAAA
jgi:predicted HicB family RNase H-like nuclease